jgi:hypothetical protein
LARIPAVTRSIWARLRTIDQICSIASVSSNWTKQALAREWTVSPVESETKWRWKRFLIKIYPNETTVEKLGENGDKSGFIHSHWHSIPALRFGITGFPISG